MDVEREDVAQIMDKYDLVVIPVIDEIGRLLGRITIDDIVDLLKEAINKHCLQNNIHIDTKVGSYGVVEDVHSTVSHLLTEIIRSEE